MTKAQESDRAPGRPPDLRRRQAIREAAYRLLLRHGLDGFTIATLAAEAGASTATLYRWWPSKEAIVLDGYLEAAERRIRDSWARLEARGRGKKLRAIDRLRTQLVSSAKAFAGEEGSGMRSLLACFQRDEELRQLFLDRLIRPRRELDRELVRQAVEEGDLISSVDPDVLLDALYGPLYFRLFVGHAPLTKRFAERHVDQALHGLRA